MNIKHINLNAKSIKGTRMQNLNWDTATSTLQHTCALSHTDHSSKNFLMLTLMHNSKH